MPCFAHTNKMWVILDCVSEKTLGVPIVNLKSASGPELGFIDLGSLFVDPRVALI